MIPEIENQLRNLEDRHKRHQRLMDWQKEWKSIRRERHRQGWHKRRPCPITLI